MNPEAARLDVTADLSIEVDGAPVRVTAEGGDVHVVTDDVGAFVRGLRAAAAARNGSRPGRADVATLAGALADVGITARLDSPSQHLVTVGAGVDSALGGALLGTRLAQPDALGIVRVSLRARTVAIAAAATGAAALLAAGSLGVRRRR